MYNVHLEVRALVIRPLVINPLVVRPLDVRPLDVRPLERVVTLVRNMQAALASANLRLHKVVSSL